MSGAIDCLFIGINDIDFAEHEKSVREMGTDTGAYRDLNLSFIRYKNKPYHLTGIFNLFYCDNVYSEREGRPLGMGEVFSPTIAYLATYLFRRGFTYDYINSFQDEKEVLAQKLQQENYLTVAVTTTFYVSIDPVVEIVNFIKKYNRTAKIIVGGPLIATQVRMQPMHPVQEESLLDFLFQSMGADFYVNSSQGEAALVKIIEALKSDSPVETIHNIYYKDGDGYTAAPVSKEDNKLSENTVDWNLFAHGLEKHVGIRTSISCPFSCAFCSFPGHAGKHQAVGVELVESELNALAGVGSVKTVNFIDDTFNIPVKRFKEILRMLVKNRYEFQWNAHFRCQYVEREMVELMKESRCGGVFLGIESGSDQILKNMNKAASVEKFLEGIALLREYDILTFASFIVGFPGETDDTVRDTIRFIEESGIEFYRAQLWYCDPLTPVWKERERYKLSGSNFEWEHATMDSRTACDWIDKMFLSINKSVWAPQYNFDLDHLFHMTHRGFTPEEVKNIINVFNGGVKEKLIDRTRKEVSTDIIKQLKQSIQKYDPFDRSAKIRNKSAKDYKVEFNF